MKRIDKFVDDTSMLWFLALIMTVGFLWWLIIWACYEIIMSILLKSEPSEESNKTRKKREKNEKKFKEAQKTADKIAEDLLDKSKKTYI